MSLDSFKVIQPLSILIFNGHNHVPHSSSQCLLVKEGRVSIAMHNPIVPRLLLPKQLFFSKNCCKFSFQFQFKTNKPICSIALKSFLNTTNASHPSFPLEDITK